LNRERHLSLHYPYILCHASGQRSLFRHYQKPVIIVFKVINIDIFSHKHIALLWSHGDYLDALFSHDKAWKSQDMFYDDSNCVWRSNGGLL